jgi:hypothetical protein
LRGREADEEADEEAPSIPERREGAVTEQREIA